MSLAEARCGLRGGVLSLQRRRLEYFLEGVYLRSFLTVRNLENFFESVKNEATVDVLCGYVYVRQPVARECGRCLAAYSA